MKAKGVIFTMLVVSGFILSTPWGFFCGGQLLPGFTTPITKKAHYLRLFKRGAQGGGIWKFGKVRFYRGKANGVRPCRIMTLIRNFRSDSKANP